MFFLQLPDFPTIMTAYETVVKTFSGLIGIGCSAGLFGHAESGDHGQQSGNGLQSLGLGLASLGGATFVLAANLAIATNAGELGAWALEFYFRRLCCGDAGVAGAVARIVALEQSALRR